LTPVPFQIDKGPSNKAGENLGSLVILWDARERALTVADTLPLFGKYLDEVVQNPNGEDHANIRALMKHDPAVYIGSIVNFYGHPIHKKT
jgi:hypothetical protein